jgi:ATP-binding cassette subfamily B protein
MNIKIPNRVMPFIWHFVKKQPVAFTVALVTALIWSMNEVFFPYFIKLIINIIANYRGEPHSIYSALSLPLIALVSCWLFMDICMRVQGMVLIYAFPRLRANIREASFNYTKQHSHNYFSNNFAGSIAQKLSSLPTSCQNVLEIFLFNFCSISVGVVIAFILMWLANPIFAVILLAWFCVHMGITWIFLQAGNRRWELHSKAVTTLSGKVVDSITNTISMRLFSRGRYESDYLKKAQMDEIKKAHKAQWNIEIMRVIQGIAGLSLIFSMIFTLIHGWTEKWVTLGDFSLVGMLSFWILGMVWYMSYQIGLFVRESSTINEALTLIGVKHEVVDMPDALPLRIQSADIHFDNVVFEYQKNIPVFNRLNLNIPTGQKVGLVGFSGSGKSTFVNLMLRLYDLTSGQILIDGQNIAKVTQDSLRENIAMIPQDPALFHRTLMENIRYGRLDATDAEVLAAAKLAHCHEFIEKLPEGYQALVGERGIKLSGGQRQRIAIARAILKNAPILILDEATSSLDSVTERLIQDSLKHLMHDKTTLVVAHRLSTLADMDRILVFHKGEIMEEGTQEQLLKQNGHFAHLWKMQTHGFLPENDGDDNVL